MEQSERLMYDRFLEVIEKEANKLREKEGSEINPTGKKTVLVDSFASDDDCVYIYTLYSLDLVLSLLASFSDDLATRKEANGVSFLYLDKNRFVSLPHQIAFHLRGFIGVISEDSMILEGEKLKKMQNLLKGWSGVDMTDGTAQDELYQFLCDYQEQHVKDILVKNPSVFASEEDKNDFVKYWVEWKLKAFKEILLVSTMIVKGMFDHVWDGLFGYKRDG
jgi:hypothetical protein